MNATASNHFLDRNAGASEQTRRLSLLAVELLAGLGWKRSKARGGLWAMTELRNKMRYNARSAGAFDDHGKLYRRGRHLLYVAEPYGLTARSLSELAAFCLRYRLRYHAGLPAVWNPPACVAVWIWPAADPLPYKPLAEGDTPCP